MGKVTIELEPYYTNRAYYPYIPAAVFDALEAAYLEGAESAEIPEEEYNELITNLKDTELCQK